MPLRYIHDSITNTNNAAYAIRWFTDNGRDPNDTEDPGNPEMMGDWSAEQKIFWIENGSNESYLAERAIIFMSVKGSIDSGGFGNGPALTNGLRFYYYSARNDLYIDGFGTNFIYHNEDWAKHCYDTRVHTYGKGNESFCARWTFSLDGGPITVEPRDKLVMVIQDDLTAHNIEEFTIKIGGRYLRGDITPANPQPIITYP